MLHFPVTLIVLGLTVLLTSPLFAADVPTPELGELQFEDAFERDEPTPGKEEVGSGWTTNSRWRAAGNQQVDLVDGVIHITRYPSADHGVAVFHPVDFQDGTVQLRFKLDKGDQLGVDFADKELKTVHAGHLCVARMSLNKLVINDSKTGRMDLKNREKLQAGDKSPELMKLLQTKTASFPVQLKPNTWHDLKITITGDTMTVSIDGKEAGQLKSPGIAHPTKRHISLAVNKEAWVDDVKIWKKK